MWAQQHSFIQFSAVFKIYFIFQYKLSGQRRATSNINLMPMVDMSNIGTTCEFQDIRYLRIFSFSFLKRTLTLLLPAANVVLVSFSCSGLLIDGREGGIHLNDASQKKLEHHKQGSFTKTKLTRQNQFV